MELQNFLMESISGSWPEQRDMHLFQDPGGQDPGADLTPGQEGMGSSTWQVRAF